MPTKIKQILIFSILFQVVISCKSLPSDTASSKEITTTLNAWHQAASNAEFEKYIQLMTPNAVFIGTDATENWQLEAFKVFSKPYFDKGKAWSFTPLQRNIYFSENKKTAWFDELLDTQMKICRGSGVLIKVGDKWKIAQYVLSMTIPNETTNQVISIKENIENSEIQKLKTNSTIKLK